MSITLEGLCALLLVIIEVIKLVIHIYEHHDKSIKK